MVLPAILILLLFSGLVIPPVLAYVSTGLQAGVSKEGKIALSYAADAGIEDALWRTNEKQIPIDDYDYETEYGYSLPEAINNKNIEVSVKQVWPLVGLESDENGTTPPLSLTTTGGIIDEDTGEYKVQISYDGSLGYLPIDRVAVWLPSGFNYVNGTSSGITTSNPASLDWHGGKSLTWDFDPAVNFTELPAPEPPSGGGFAPATEYPATRVLTFNVSVVGQQANGSYSWTRTTNSSVYLSWDTDCNIYKYSSTATDDTTGKSMTVESYTYVGEGGIFNTGGALYQGDYRAVGNTLMLDNNSDKKRETLLDESSAIISNIFEDGEVALAYLYWSGWREGDGGMEADKTVGLKINGNSVYYNDQGQPVLGELPRDPADEILRPSGSGSYTNCYRAGDYPNYKCVDEQVTDGSSTYVYSKYGYTRLDTYNVANHSEGSGTISSVTVYATGRAYYYNECSDMRMQIAARTHSTNYYGDMIDMIGNAGWDEYSKSWSVNPNTGETWTWSEIDDLQIGIKVYDDGPGYPQCTQVYAVVNYTPIFQGITASKWWLLENDYPDYSYSCFRDVTSLVRLVTTTGNATYTVSGVTGSTGSEWSYAGWSLVIVYYSPSEKAHQFFLYDHFLYADMGTSHIFDIEGFEAPEDAQAALTCFVGEGDDFYASDYLEFNNNYLSDAVNPVNNVWNGKCSGLGGEFIDGVDIDTFNVSSPIVNPGDTAAQVELTTDIDSWNLVYIILSFRSNVGGLTPNSMGIITYNYSSN